MTEIPAKNSTVLKTAEEILSDKVPAGSRNRVVAAMREFAAQEVAKEVAREIEEYKERLASEVRLLNKTRGSWLLERVLNLIDTVK